MLNILLPMAGRGSRFANVGYKDPKPFILINQKPMIQIVVENLKPKGVESRFIFICQKAHLDKYKGRELLKKLAPGCVIIEIDQITDGQLSSAMLAEGVVDNEEPLLTANTDQYIDFDFSSYLKNLLSSDLDGSILTMEGNDPKWSYVRTSSDNNLVIQTAEKEVISNEATVGVYFFKKGSDFCEASKNSMREIDKVNGEFYICPVYNYLIKRGKKIGHERIRGMYGLGTPEDLNFFLSQKISEKI